MKTVKQIIEEIRADIEIRPTPLDEQLDELLKSYESEIDGLKKEFDDTCENLAWYINERQRLLKVIEYSKPNEGLQRTIKKALEHPHGECKTCKHFVKGGLDGKTYVCEQPDIVLDDHFDYACIMMNENDFCSRYEKKEGDENDK